MLEFLSDLSLYTLLIVLSELHNDLTAVCGYNQDAAIEISKMIVMVETVMGGENAN